MQIKTNNHARPVLYWWDLTNAERAELDYYETDTAREDGRFFRYKGAAYDLGEFTRIAPAGSKGGPSAHYDHTGDLAGWDGIATDSYFSGIVVKYRDDFDAVVVGLALS